MAPLGLTVPANPSSPTASQPLAMLAGLAGGCLGVVVPKRWAKRAVTRNTIKRQVFSVSQDFEPDLPVAAYVVRLRSGFDRSRFPSATSEPLKAALRLELQQLFQDALARLTAAAVPRAS
jgi:ribonuclease P protein component